ncbi:hypothetical protein SCHPADRAFT_273999 [Schizopora paradoxa]|uniref:DUF6533 domain-containing protein n=1 Tax=Schizopora paradoxa TaxID=27342 RepID=A0A0H2RUK3_9AGAM|nr:hypothetical protein SCHPADRAFT_273999 [Schizopora paradoxa]
MSNQLERVTAQDAEFLRIFRYTLVSAVALVAYEYFSTLRDEIRFLWNRRLTVGRILFFLNRYLPIMTVALSSYTYLIITNSDNSTCHNLVNLTCILVYVDFIVALGVLFTRSYVVWGFDAHIRNILLLALMAGVAGSAYVLSLFIRGAILVPLSQSPYSEFDRGCVIFFTNDFNWINYALLIVFETMTLALLIVKSINNYRHLKISDTLLNVMVKDGIGYFICNIAITAANMVILSRTTDFLRYFLLITQSVLENILCNRLILHVFIVHDARTKCSSIPLAFGRNSSRTPFQCRLGDSSSSEQKRVSVHYLCSYLKSLISV